MATPTHVDDSILREHLIELLRGGSAHADLDTSIANFPAHCYGIKPEGAPHSSWQLLEHLRIALNDLLVFSTDSHYMAPKWPDDYWPKEEAPASSKDWQRTVETIKADLAAFEKLIHNPSTDLYAKIPWGDGQTILREVLLAADHNSYHLGQLVLLRKELNIWEN